MLLKVTAIFFTCHFACLSGPSRALIVAFTLHDIVCPYFLPLDR